MMNKSHFWLTFLRKMDTGEPNQEKQQINIKILARKAFKRMIKNRKKISALSDYKDTKTLTKIEKRICKWNLKPYLHQTKSKNLP